MAQVRRVGEGAARLAARTRASASAWRGVSRLVWGVGVGEGKYLGLGVVLGLQDAADDGPALVGVDQVRLVVADDAGRARVDERLDARLLARLDHGRGAVDVDLFEQRVRHLVVGLGGGGRRVDDDLRPGLGEDSLELAGVGDVGLVVGHAVRVGPPVARAAEVDDGDAARVVAQEHAHDVVAEEAAAADDHDRAELWLLFGRHVVGLGGGSRR